MGGRQVAAGMSPAETARRLRVGVYDLYWSDARRWRTGRRQHRPGARPRTTTSRCSARRRLDVDATHASPRCRPVGMRVSPGRRRRRGRRGQRRLRPVRQRHLPQQGVNRAPSATTTCTSPVRYRPGATISAVGWASSGVKALSLAPRLPQRLTEVQAAFDRRVDPRRVRADLHPLSRQLAVHGVVGRAALGTTERRALPAGATERPARRQGSR